MSDGPQDVTAEAAVPSPRRWRALPSVPIVVRVLALVATTTLPVLAEEAPPASPPALLCEPLVKLTAALAERFHETPGSAGLDSSGQLVEVFASPAGDTWTLVSVSPAGIACVLATGKRWVDAATVGTPA